MDHIASGSQLVLGGAGFVGRHLARALFLTGCETTAIDRAPSSPLPAGVAYHPADLGELSVGDLAELIAPHSVIYHLAWSSIPATSEAEPLSDLTENVGLMIKLLQAMRGTSKTLVFTSSGGTVYGRNDAEKIDEDQPLSPISAYAAAKIAAENYAAAARESYGTDVRIARLSNPYGAGQSALRPQGAVTRFVHTALAGGRLQIWGDGEIVRDYVHVNDLVDGLALLGHATRAQLAGQAVFNIASGQGASLNQVVRIIQAIAPRPVAVDYSTSRFFDVPRNVLDIGRAERLLRWRPKITLVEGISRTLNALIPDPDQLFSTLGESGAAASPPSVRR